MGKTTVRTVLYGETAISYTFERKNVKNINLRVKSDRTVCVSAPAAVSTERVDGFVSEKGQFILNAIEKFAERAENAPKAHEYISGERFRILGHELELVVKEGNKGVYVDSGKLYIETKNVENFSEKERKFQHFRDELCREVFSRQVKKVYPLFEPMGVAYPGLKIRDMKSRWGSCIPQKGIITLNKRLISAPEKCIEYVTVHEFCHFIHPDHSKAFYGLLERLMPDWKARKTELNNY